MKKDNMNSKVEVNEGLHLKNVTKIKRGEKTNNYHLVTIWNTAASLNCHQNTIRTKSGHRQGGFVVSQLKPTTTVIKEERKQLRKQKLIDAERRR